MSAGEEKETDMILLVVSGLVAMTVGFVAGLAAGAAIGWFAGRKKQED